MSALLSGMYWGWAGALAAGAAGDGGRHQHALLALLTRHGLQWPGAPAATLLGWLLFFTWTALHGCRCQQYLKSTGRLVHCYTCACGW